MRHRSMVAAAVLVAGLTAVVSAQRGAGSGPAGGVPAPAIGLIVGRVVDAGTGQPVAEAEVTVSMRAAAPPSGAAGLTPPFTPGAAPANARLLTGADGRFVVRDLPAGNVQLSVRAPGYLSGSHGQTRPNGASRPIQISAENRTVSASVRLWKHAVVSGIVTDERNEPGININVQVLTRSYRNGQSRFTLAGFGRTDDRGMYRAAGLAPGEYVVVVPQTQTSMPAAAMDQMMQSMMGGQGFAAAEMTLAASGVVAGGGARGVRVGDQMVSSQSGALAVLSADGPNAAYVTQYFPAATTVSQATVLTLASGEERSGIDIRMPLAPTSRIRGFVMGPEGPLANAQLRLLSVAETDSGDIGNDVARSASAANGAFQMFGVPAGQYLVKVVRPGRQAPPAAIANNPQLAALMGGGGPISPADALTLFADVQVSVERDIMDLTITLATGATVSGRVEFVGTAPPPPFTGISVMLTPMETQGPPMRATPVSADGRFSTTGNAAGKYVIGNAGRTAAGWFLKSAIVNGIDAVDQPFELGAENIGNVVLTYTDRQATISGTLTDAASAPAEGTVIVFPAAYREWIAKGMSSRLTRNIRTQAKGAFSIAGLPGRDYLIVAVPDDLLPDMQNPAVYEALARAATSLTLSDGDTRTMSIRLAQVVR